MFHGVSQSHRTITICRAISLGQKGLRKHARLEVSPSRKRPGDPLFPSTEHSQNNESRINDKPLLTFSKKIPLEKRLSLLVQSSIKLLKKRKSLGTEIQPSKLDARTIIENSLEDVRKKGGREGWKELVRATANFATCLENDDATTITIYVWRVRLAKRPPLSLSPSRKGTSASWCAFLRWPPRTRRKGMEKEEEGKERRGGYLPAPYLHACTHTHTHRTERESTAPLFTG